MKKIILYILFLYPILSFSQVGIGTETPTRTLDINGNLRIRELDNKTTSGDASYSHLLSAKDDDKDASNNIISKHGELGKVSFTSLLQSSSNNLEVKRVIYQGDVDKTQECSCGILSIFLDQSAATSQQIYPFVRLNYLSIFDNNNTDSFGLNYGQKKYIDTSYIYDNHNITFDKTGGIEPYNKLDDLKFDGNTIRIYTIILPGGNNLYRLTISRFLTNPTTYINSLICEKFYVQQID